MVLDRFARTAKTVFVRSASYAPDEPTYWAIERKLFLELEDPFSEIPEPVNRNETVSHRV